MLLNLTAVQPSVFPERENVPQQLILFFVVFVSNETHPILAFAKPGRAASVQSYLSNVKDEHPSWFQSRESTPKHMNQRLMTVVRIILIAEDIA